MGSHLIHTQLLEANFLSKTSALSGQKLLQERYWEVLLPMMEQVFDAFGPIGRSIRIDKLELDLGRFPADLPEIMMRDRLRDVLEGQLRKIYLEKGILTHTSSDKVLSQDHFTTPKSHSDWEKISYYLSYGRMPWWVSTKKKEPIQSLFDRVSASNDSWLKSWIKKSPISSAMAKRMVSLLSKSQFESLVKNSLQLSGKDIQLVNQLLELLLSNTTLKKTEVRFWLNTAILFSIFGTRNSVTTYFETGFKAIKIADKNHALQTSQFLISLSFFILKISEGLTFSGAEEFGSYFIERLNKNTKAIAKKKNSFPTTNQFWQEVVENLRKVTLGEKEFATLSKELFQQESQEKKKLESKSPEIDELVIINNAGLVLTAAFLPRFFENIGLVKSGKFISEQAQIKAVIILQEMLGTEQEYDETDLLLNKLLCGISPASALGLVPKVTPSEKKEIDLLLESMATQWTALKSTSGKMVADGFFRREGSLRRIQRGYQLQIQRLPFDLLLDRLPWTIGMIKLPWMEELLIVEW